MTPGAVQQNWYGGFYTFTGFVTKINPVASGNASLIYSTYLGEVTTAYAIAVDSTGAAYITGTTSAPTNSQFPLVNAIQNTGSQPPTYKAFITKLNNTGSAWVYSTYLGGDGQDEGHGIAVDAQGAAYVTGRTQSSATTFPLVNAYQGTRSGPGDVFMTKVPANPSPTNGWVYSTFLGGNQDDHGAALAVNAAGEATVTGWTASVSFPQQYSLAPHTCPPNNSRDFFVTRFSDDGQTLRFSTCVGSTVGDEEGNAIWVDAQDTIYIAGVTGSSGTPSGYVFPIAGVPFQGNWGGGSSDGFLSAIRLGSVPNALDPRCFGLPGDIVGHENACPYGLDGANLATGNQVWPASDLQVADAGLPLDWGRTYNSRNPASGPLGQGWSLSFDAHLTLGPAGAAGPITATLENGAQSVYSYSGGLYQAPLGEEATLTWHGAPDNVFWLVRPDQSVLTFAPNGQLQSLNDSAAHTIRLTRDGNGRLTSLRDSIGRSYTLTRDGAGHITRLDDPNTTPPRAVNYTYSGDLLTTVTDLKGNVTRYAYDSGQRLSVVTAGDGTPDQKVRLQSHYDTLGRLIWQQSWQDNLPYTLTYDLAAPPLGGVPLTRTQVLDSGGRTALYDSDARSRLWRATDAAGKLTTFSLDSNDHVLAATDPLLHTDQATYDALGNVLTATNALNQATGFGYDVHQYPATVRDALGQTSVYTYTAEGLLAQERDALGAISTYTYGHYLQTNGDYIWRRTGAEDALHRVTQYAYNSLGQLTRVTDARQRKTSMTYDNVGNLLTTSDPSSVVECRHYNADNTLLDVVRNCVPGGQVDASTNVTDTYGYDPLHRVKAAKNAGGEVSKYTYDGHGALREVLKDCLDANGDPTVPECGVDPPALHPEWGRYTITDYDGFSNPINQWNERGYLTQTLYDTLNRPWRTIRNAPRQAGDPPGSTTTRTFYDDSRVQFTTDPLGRRSLLEYDAAGQVIATTQNYVDGNPLTGNPDEDLITRTAYNAVGQPVTVTLNYTGAPWNPAAPDTNIQTVTRYDALNRPYSVIQNYVDGVSTPGEPDTDRISEYRYDAVGNRVTTIDPLGRVTVTRYDEIQRPVQTVVNCTDSSGRAALDALQTTDCLGGSGANHDHNLSTLTYYTLQGTVDHTQDVLGRLTQYQYDALGRLVWQANNVGGIEPANVVTSYAYDRLGNTTVITDATQGVTHQSFNIAGWRVSVSDPSGRALQFGYNTGGQVVTTTDALSRRTVTGYDGLSRPVTTTVNWQNGIVEPGDSADQDLQTVAVYDSADRTVAQVGTDGRRTSYGLDGLDRLTGVVENVNGAAPANVSTSYSYDRLGRLTGHTDANGHAHSRSYNAAGWPTSRSDGLARATSYTYDRGGRRLTVSDPRPQTVSTSYDDLDRPLTVSALGLSPISYSYDPLRRTAMSDGTGSTGYTYDGLDHLATVSTTDGTVTAGYDALGRRTSLSTNTGAPTLTYGYDPAGRLLTVQRNGTAYASAGYDAVGRLQTRQTANNLQAGYSYDGANRLTTLTYQPPGCPTSCDVVAQYQYTLQRGGQVSQEAATGATLRTAGYGYDGLQRLHTYTETLGTTLNVSSYGYDAVGNRQTVLLNGAKQGPALNYDAADQVVGQSYDSAGNLLGDGTNTYSYNALNQLTSTAPNVAYAYNGDGALVSEAAGASTTRYLLDPTGGQSERLSRTANGTTTVYLRGWGAELADETGGTASWYVTDRLGSVRAITNSSGSVTGQYTYDAWGTPTSPAAGYGFTGEPQTPAGGGLLYLRARWYRPGTGRFLTTDPYAGSANSPASLHRYLYGADDPVDNTDPSGQTTGCSWCNWLTDHKVENCFDYSRYGYNSVGDCWGTHANSEWRPFSEDVTRTSVRFNAGYLSRVTGTSGSTYSQSGAFAVGGFTAELENQSFAYFPTGSLFPRGPSPAFVGANGGIHVPPISVPFIGPMAPRGTVQSSSGTGSSASSSRGVAQVKAYLRSVFKRQFKGRTDPKTGENFLAEHEKHLAEFGDSMLNPTGRNAYLADDAMPVSRRAK